LIFELHEIDEHIISPKKTIVNFNFYFIDRNTKYCLCRRGTTASTIQLNGTDPTVKSLK